MQLTNATPAEYKRLSYFETTDQLNAATRRHLYENSHALSKAAIAIFKTLKNYAVKYIGVAFMRYEKLAAACDVSYSTVKRAIKALKKCGMLDVHRTTRTKGIRGGFGHSVFIIAPCDPSCDPSEMNRRQNATNADIASDEGAQVAAEATPCEASTTNSNANESNAGAREAAARIDTARLGAASATSRDEGAADQDNLSESAADLDATYAHVPADFAAQAAPFFDAHTTQKLFRRVQRAFYRYGGGLEQEDVTAYMGEVCATLKRCVYTMKQGKLRGDMAGYFYKAVANTFENEYYAKLAELVDVDGGGEMPAWLN